jgi:hypothetical protein
MNGKRRMPRRLAYLVAMFLLVLPSRAASQQVPAAGWKFIITPYLLFPNMNGTVTVGPLVSDVNANPSDIFSNLQFGFMLGAEARSPEWAIGLNALYMDLGKDGADLPTRFDGYQGSFELTGFRRLMPWFEVLAGGRLNIMGASASLQSVGTVFDEDVAFFDPFLGARFTVPNTGRWDLMLRGDVGGFGIGSQFTWQVRPTVAYRVSKLVSLGAAYWVFGVNYDQGSGLDYFKWDVTTFGLELGISFTF